MLRFTNYPIRKDLIDRKDRFNNAAACYCIVCAFLMTTWVIGASIYTLVK